MNKQIFTGKEIDLPSCQVEKFKRLEKWDLNKEGFGSQVETFPSDAIADGGRQ